MSATCILLKLKFIFKFRNKAKFGFRSIKQKVFQESFETSKKLNKLEILCISRKVFPLFYGRATTSSNIYLKVHYFLSVQKL